jgi:hypothetical protein
MQPNGATDTLPRAHLALGACRGCSDEKLRGDGWGAVAALHYLVAHAPASLRLLATARRDPPLALALLRAWAIGSRRGCAS